MRKGISDRGIGRIAKTVKSQSGDVMKDIQDMSEFSDEEKLSIDDNEEDIYYNIIGEMVDAAAKFLKDYTPKVAGVILDRMNSQDDLGKELVFNIAEEVETEY